MFVSRGAFVVLWVTRGAFVYAGAHGVFDSPDGEDQTKQVMNTVWRGPVKKKDLGKMKGTLLHADPNGLKEKYPNFAEFMTAASFEGSTDRRVAPTITFWADGGQWKCNVRDREEGLCMWLSGGSLRELLDVIEMFCQEEEGPWRHDEVAHDRYKKRKKEGS